MGTGDRPIFPLLNQRLDKKDLNLISTFIQASINRSLGSLFSGNGGLMTTLEYSLTYNSATEVAVSFSPFRAAWSAPLVGDPNVYDGGIMVFDPARPGQVTSSWPIEAFQGQGTIFWAKRMASNGTIDNRAQWQGGTKYAATVTVESEYVEIVPRLATAGPPDASFAWVQIAYIQTSGWSGYTPVIRPVYYPDAKHFNDGAGPGTPNWWSLYDPDVGGGGDPGVGPGDQARWVLNVLSRIIDSGWVFLADGRVDTDNNNGVYGWQTPPVLGLVQTKAALDVHTTQIEDHEDRITDLEGADPTSGLVRDSLVLEFRYNVGTGGYDKTVLYTNGWLTSSHTTAKDDPGDVGGAVVLTLSSAGGAHTIYHIDAQAVRSASGDPPWGSDPPLLSLSYGEGALPGTSLIAEMQAGEHPNLSINRILVRILAGKTP